MTKREFGSARTMVYNYAIWLYNVGFKPVYVFVVVFIKSIYQLFNAYLARLDIIVERSPCNIESI